ncbi:MAG: HK97 family phage prohead protease [Bacteroidales bacterium]|nr:HK97 family phage prohead protease [Bacteroidales bacterium]
MDKILTRTITPEVRKAGESRKVTFVASDSTRDTEGTVLNQAGWDLDRFNSNGIIGYQHKVYGSWDATDNPDNVIGKGQAYVEHGKLMVDVEFEPKEINELAEKVYQKILFGSLKAVSVGFLPLGKGTWGEGEEAVNGAKPTYYYAGQELLEVSVVNIPANPKALKKGIDTESEELAELRKEEEARIEAEAPAPEPEPAPEAPKPLDDLEIARTITVAEATLLT